MLDYKIQEQLIGNVNVPYFGRQTKIKWWSGMNMANHGKNRAAKTPEELLAIADEMRKTMAAISQKDSDSDNQDDFLSEDNLIESNNYSQQQSGNTFGHDLSQFQGL
ncbi:hypothetical protein LWI29_032865 [Acer saccharum]|uniref:Uncharacterized protein n=1 Tax=Acer saccharum TaxID=4024 RepID=A0AA39RT03_ACESA|nr:hypothetical protein LWI29_032865 [Acer saccharum]